jgi:hypothetical protein
MQKQKPPIVKILPIILAIVFVWRGTWGLMDLYVFPDNTFLSYTISLVLGLAILFFTEKLSDLV